MRERVYLFSLQLQAMQDIMPLWDLYWPVNKSSVMGRTSHNHSYFVKICFDLAAKRE